jgi:hypothetical protein
MLLSARMLDGVGSVNDYDYVDEVEFTEGDAVRVHFQLIDASKDKPLQQFKPAGRRFVPAVGATLKVTLANIDDDKGVVERLAVQPYAGDASIWYVDIAATDKVRGTVDLVFKLTEGTRVTRGRLSAALAVDNQGTL